MEFSLEQRQLLSQRELLMKQIELIDEKLAATGLVAEQPRPPETQSTRGRKSMPPKEREEVSERMKKYHAARRASKANGTS